MMKKTMLRFKDLFADFDQTDNVRLYNEQLPIEVFYGRDYKGRLCLALVTPFSAQMPKPTKLLDFSQTKVGHDFWTYISLADEEVRSSFFALCEDIVDSIFPLSDQKAAFQSVLDRIRVWKRMFASKSSPLSEEKIQGLFGELFFIDEYLIHKFGKEKAIKAWGGPLGMSKDFSVGLDWFEVKCASANEESVKISSHEQLLSDNPGHLVIVKVEKMPEAFNNGISTINALFEKIKLTLNDAPELLDEFMEKISKVGYVPDDSYDKYKYKVVGMNFYKVDENFPRLTSPSSFGKAISAISYNLLINAIKPYCEEDKLWTRTF